MLLWDLNTTRVQMWSLAGHNLKAQRVFSRCVYDVLSISKRAS